MNKRFLLKVGTTLLVGLLAILAYHCYLQPRDYAPPPSEKTLSEFAARHYGAAEMTPTAVLPRLPASQAVRLAIGSLGLPNDARNCEVADLVIAELTGASGLDLVERQALDLALREMSFSLSGLIRARDAIRVGKLVRADWFLLGSLVKLEGTNAIVVRVVDARTGILREAGVFAENQGVMRLARDLAGFVRQCRQNAGEGKGRTYLAIGTFEDLSLNSRQAALPGQLRSYLIAAYQGADVTLLEREAANTLLQEVRLDLAGLTEEGGTNTPAPMQSAYWMVDGSYQSYETTEFEVELVLNIRRMFGWSRQVALRETPGETLFKRVKESIDKAMARDQAALTPTRMTELRVQLGIGWDLLQNVKAEFRGFVYDWIPYTGSQSASEVARHRRNTEEAIRAFETAMLLDPNQREAKMGLAECLQKAFILRVDQARDLYREILEASVKDQWTSLAQQTLQDSFRWESPDAKRRWFEAAAQRAASAAALEFYRSQLQTANEEAILEKRGTSEAEGMAEERLLRDVLAWEKAVRSRLFILDFDNTGLGKFVEAFGTNRARAAQRLVELLPSLQAVSSNLAPHLLAGVVTFQVDTNAAIISDFERTLDEYSKRPQKLFEPDYYFGLLASPVHRWAEQKKLYALAAKTKELRICAASQDRGLLMDAEDKMGLAFSYLRAELWQKALDIFQSYSNRPVLMGNRGLWGPVDTVVLTSKQAALCRERLGLPPLNDPREFDLGNPCLYLHTTSEPEDRTVIATTLDGLGIGIRDQVISLDFELRTNFIARIHTDNFAPFSTFCPGGSNVWIGTEGGGLLEMDKSTRKIRRFTDKDGLLMDYVSGLHLAGQTLWIGYGNESGGGLGRLDLSTRRVTSFSASLLSESNVAKPPRQRITEIQTGPAGDVWFLAKSSLYSYRPAVNTWKVQPSRNGVWTRCYALDTEHLVEGLEIATVELTIEARPGTTGTANPPQRITRVVSYDESARLQAVLRTNRSGQRVSGSSTGSSPPRGGLEMRTFRDGHRERLLEAEGLPNPPTTLTLHGSELWVGGQGFVALVDLNGNKIKKLAYVPARSVDRIQLGGGYVWAQFDKHLHRAPLSDLQ